MDIRKKVRNEKYFNYETTTTQSGTNTRDLDINEMEELDPILIEDVEEDGTAQKGEKLKTWIDSILTWGEKGADVYGKLKNGAKVYDEGDAYEIYPEDKDSEKYNKKLRTWLIATGIIVALVILVLVIMKKKNAGKGK